MQRSLTRSLVLLFLLALARPSPAQADPTRELQLAAQEYERGDYNRTVEILEPQLYPRPLVPEDEILDARKMLGISFFYLGREDRARQEFVAILINEDPDFALDPVVESPDVVKFVDKLKEELKKQLDVIREARELKKREEERRLIESRVKYERVILREYRPRKPGLNWVPFGVGQFKNGDKGWGTFFLASEGVLGGVSAGIFLYQFAKYGPSIPLKKPSDPDELKELRSLQIVQIGSGALFLVAYAAGVVHAYANTPDEGVEKETLIDVRPFQGGARPPATTPEGRPSRDEAKLQIAPLLTPETVGLGVTWEF